MTAPVVGFSAPTNFAADLASALALSQLQATYITVRANNKLLGLAGVSTAALMSWLVSVKQNTQSAAWHVVDEVPISTYEHTPEGLLGTTISADYAKVIYNSALQCAEAKTRISNLIRTKSALSQRGPELMDAIQELFLPTKAENYMDRHTDFVHAVQGNEEGGTEFLARLNFLRKRFAKCPGASLLSDATVRDQLYLGVLTGPYHSTVSAALQRTVGKESRLPLICKRFGKCTSSDLAKVVDHLLYSTTTNAKFFKSNHLVKGESMMVIQPQGLGISLQVTSDLQPPAPGRSSGQARRAGGTPSAAPTTSTLPATLSLQTLWRSLPCAVLLPHLKTVKPLLPRSRPFRSIIPA